MERCDNQNPCPVCKRYSDGCLYAKDGSAAICVRTPEGAVKMAGEAGWFHILKPGQFKPKPVKKKRPIPINWESLNKCYTQTFQGIAVRHLSNPFQVYGTTLRQIETGWDREAYTFPVRDSDDQIIGIQRRFPDGSKGMVKGSQIGIFIPRIYWDNLESDICPLFICEGVSDTATALDMGLCAIGRVSCSTGKEHIIKFCIKKRPTRIIIVADNDEVGIRGAKALGLWISQGYKLFSAPPPDIKIITPPTGSKDLRIWRENGLTLEKLMETVNLT